MLVHQDNVSIRVREHQARGAGGGFIGFGVPLHAFAFQVALDVRDVVKLGEVLAALVQPGLKVRILP